jgi:hypothetical protein
MKGIYTCTACGETARSKCAAQRSIFPGNQLATMIGNRLISKVEVNKEGELWGGKKAKEYKVTLEFYPVIAEGETTDPMQEMLNVLRTTDPEVLRIALCRHDWELTSETCEFGCCRRKGT